MSAAIIDAHAGVPGAGVAEPDTLVMVLGTSSCHMLNSRQEKLVPGVAGVVAGGILPGYFGYETGQAAVGDAFDWLRRLCGAKDFSRSRSQGRRAAARRRRRAGPRLAQRLPHAADGRLADRRLHRPGAAARAGASLSRAAGGLRLRPALDRGAADRRRRARRTFVATGGLPHHNPLLVQIYADVLGQPIAVPPSQHGPALGAAILGVLAAGPKASGFRSPTAAIVAMAGGKARNSATIVKPQRANRKAYDALYAAYRDLAQLTQDLSAPPQA